MAGFTTTGASTIRVPEEVAPSLLLWRSLTQWTGGIGIVLIFVAVAPLVGFGAAQLYSAELASPVAERLTPRIQDTAKILVYVYGALTLGGVAALLVAGMGPFDAVNYALTTVSTGGYSTHSDSIAAFDSWGVELYVVAGMVLSGVNFTLYFQATQGRLRRVLENRELQAYLGIIAGGTAVMTASLYAFDYRDSLIVAFREALFQSASLLTGTAFSTANWQAWDPFSQSVLMLFMAIGAMAGSTSGGLKVIRAVLLMRHGVQEAFHMVHPQAITPLRLGNRVVPERLRAVFLGFFFVYVATLAAGTLLMALHGLPTGSAFGSVFACLNITGTALGPVGDPGFYAGLPASAKVILTVFMLLGRLELFTVLVLLTPAFWRS
jgi:trk system potassium uptake protein TrkH